jgi:hypothetical protein
LKEYLLHHLHALLIAEQVKEMQSTSGSHAQTLTLTHQLTTDLKHSWRDRAFFNVLCAAMKNLILLNKKNM